MTLLLELATTLNLEVANAAGNPAIVRASSIESAQSGSLVFALDEAHTAAALASSASAVILPETLRPEEGSSMPVLLSQDPRLDFARAARLLQHDAARVGVHPTAVIDGSAEIAPTALIAAFAVVGAEVRVGDRASIGEGAVLGEGVVVGRSCRIYPRAVLYPGTVVGDRVVIHAGAVLGADGFGYVRDRATGAYIQFPQQGRLVLEDDVEIGANTTIDRGALEETRIGRGTKIDNLVHLGHNVQVGQDTVIAAQTGISGSTTVGSGVMLGGQVGIGDHAVIGDGVILGGQGGVLPGKTLNGQGVVFWGTPAQPVREFLRELGILRRLRRSRKDETRP